MAGRYHQRPENAIAKADEFIKVGKMSRALDTLYDVFKSKKRYHTYSEKLIEQIMFKYLELCVDLRKSHIAKEGLFQYRNMCQLTNVASLAAVVQGYLNLAEQRTEAARQESVESAAEVDDLDNLNTPEMIMLSAVSGEDAQDRSDRKILMPWVKFLWESYCQCLELLRTNIRVERLYHDIAQQAFRFCLKYQRKTEFRKLCDKLRNHLDLVQKQTPSQMSINLNNADTQQMNLDTRLAQLDAAIQMELWQEAYKAVEDIHGLMAMSKKVFPPKMMANYYQKLALVFWKSGNLLFHAAAVFKHFQLTRDMKKNISAEEQGKMASRVLAACLAVPIPSHHPEFDKFIETDKTPQEKMAKLAVLLSLQQPPTRQSLLKDCVRFGVVSVATQPLQDLHRWLEVEFHPLKVCIRVQETLKVIEDSDEKTMLAQYMQSLRDITLVRLLKQVSQVYQSICFNKLLSLAPFTNSFELERTIVDCVRHNDMQVRVDHRTRTVHFGSNVSDVSVSEVEGPHLQDMPSEQIRTQLMQMLEVLDKSLKTIHPDKLKIDNNKLREKIVEAYHTNKTRRHQQLAKRQATIEGIKQQMEEKSTAKDAEEAAKKQLEENEKKRREEQRLKEANEKAQKEKEERKIEEIRQAAMKGKIDTLISTGKGDLLEGKTEEEIANLTNDEIIIMQVKEIEKQKQELEARLKAQAKGKDHMERAKRQEEIPILKEAIEKDQEEDRAIWAKKEEDRIKQAVEDRDEAVKNRDRLARMKEDKEDFMSTLLKQRKDIYEKKLKEYNAMIDKQRQIRLEEKKRERIERAREDWYREKEEYEQRMRDEALKRERERKEAEEAARKAEEEARYKEEEERLKAIEKKKEERMKEIEAREREKEEARRAEDRNQRDSRGPPRGGDRDQGEDRWRRGGGERERSPERGGGGSWRPSAAKEGGGGWRDRVKQKDEEWGPRGGDRRGDDRRRDDDDGPRRRDDDGPRRRDDDGPRRRDDDGPRRRDDDGPRRRDDEDNGPWRRGPNDGPRRDDGPRRRDDEGPRRRDEDGGGPDNWRQGPRGGGGDRDRDGGRGPPPRRFENDREERGGGGGGWRDRPAGGGGQDPGRDDRRGPDRRDDRDRDGGRGPPPRRFENDREERGGGGGWRDRAAGGRQDGPPRRDDRRGGEGGGGGGGSWRRQEDPAPRSDDRRRPPPAKEAAPPSSGGGDDDGDWQTVSKR